MLVIFMLFCFVSYYSETYIKLLTMSVNVLDLIFIYMYLVVMSIHCSYVHIKLHLHTLTYICPCVFMTIVQLGIMNLYICHLDLWLSGFGIKVVKVVWNGLLTIVFFVSVCASSRKLIILNVISFPKSIYHFIQHSINLFLWYFPEICSFNLKTNYSIRLTRL